VFELSILSGKQFCFIEIKFKKYFPKPLPINQDKLRGRKKSPLAPKGDKKEKKKSPKFLTIDWDKLLVECL